MNEIPVKIKRMHPDAVIPQYATNGSAGFDLVVIEDVIIAPGETKLVRARDSYNADHYPLLINGDFAERMPEIYAEGSYLIRKGDRIAQGIIAPVYRAVFADVDELSDTERGEDGFGSTGIKIALYHDKTMND